MLLSKTNSVPTNPRYFSMILTPTPKKILNKDSMEEIIPDGALKKERA